MRLLSSSAASRSLSLMGEVLGEIIPVPVPEERLALVDRLPRDGEARLALLLHGADKTAVLDAAHALKLSNEQKKRVVTISQITPPREITPPATRRFLREAGEDARRAAKILSLLGLCGGELETAIVEEEAKSPCLTVGGLKINGNDLISGGIASGRAVGETLSALLEAVIDSPHLNEKDTLLNMARKFNR